MPYSTQSDLQDIFGITNIATWSQLDPTQPPNTPDTTRIQRAINDSDARIISFFRNYGNYLSPLSPQGTDVTLVTRWSATLAGIWLYDSRGQRDDTREVHKYQEMRRAILNEMSTYRAHNKLDAARRWPAPTAPAAS